MTFWEMDEKYAPFILLFPQDATFYDLFQLFATKIKFMVLNFECYFEYSMIYVVHVIFLGIIVVQSRFTYLFCSIHLAVDFCIVALDFPESCTDHG